MNDSSSSSIDESTENSPSSDEEEEEDDELDELSLAEEEERAETKVGRWMRVVSSTISSSSSASDLSRLFDRWCVAVARRGIPAGVYSSSLKAARAAAEALLPLRRGGATTVGLLLLPVVSLALDFGTFVALEAFLGCLVMVVAVVCGIEVDGVVEDEAAASAAAAAARRARTTALGGRPRRFGWGASGAVEAPAAMGVVVVARSLEEMSAAFAGAGRARARRLGGTVSFILRGPSEGLGVLDAVPGGEREEKVEVEGWEGTFVWGRVGGREEVGLHVHSPSQTGHMSSSSSSSGIWPVLEPVMMCELPMV